MNLVVQSHVAGLRADPYPDPDYRVCRTPRDLVDYLTSWYHVTGTPRVIGADTESRPGGQTHCLTFSHTPGTGRLIYTDDLATLSAYRDFILAIDPVQVFHNWLHDTVPMTALAIPHSNFIDTMVWAYNLCLGGGADDDEESRAGRGYLGLKPLSYRLLNMTMTSFKDTVYPYSGLVLGKWLEDLVALTSSVPLCQCTHPTTQHKVLESISGKTGKVTKRKAGCQSPGCTCTKHKALKLAKTPDDKLYGLLNRKAGNLLTDIVAGNKPDLDPWDRISQWNDWDRDQAVTMLGPWPVPSIEHLPESVLVHYACRDADADLRLYHYLLALQNGAVGGGPWIWYD